MPGRTLAIGDIHGCDVALETLLSNVGPVADDTVVVLGDVVDRGPDSKRVIDLLLELEKACNFKLIMGNHEEMMLDAYHRGDWMEDWLRFGGRETLDSYGNDFEEVPPEHLEFLSAGLPFWDTPTEIYVHANLDPFSPLRTQLPEWLRWERLRGTELPHSSGRPVICGHTVQPSGMPLVFDGWVCIDTWAYGKGRLSCLDVSSGMLYQSNQAGDSFDAVPIGSFA